jgi:hypothetical protein
LPIAKVLNQLVCIADKLPANRCSLKISPNTPDQPLGGLQVITPVVYINAGRPRQWHPK